MSIDADAVVTNFGDSLGRVLGYWRKHHAQMVEVVEVSPDLATALACLTVQLGSIEKMAEAFDEELTS